eukprot:scaffold62697_cov57-Phaeocystis_antarctica.AAC.1
MSRRLVSLLPSKWKRKRRSTGCTIASTAHSGPVPDPRADDPRAEDAAAEAAVGVWLRAVLQQQQRREGFAHRLHRRVMTRRPGLLQACHLPRPAQTPQRRRRPRRQGLAHGLDQPAHALVEQLQQRARELCACAAPLAGRLGGSAGANLHRRLRRRRLARHARSERLQPQQAVQAAVRGAGTGVGPVTVGPTLARRCNLCCSHELVCGDEHPQHQPRLVRC